MTETHYMALISALFLVILGMVKWVGMRIFGKLDNLSEQMTTLHSGLQKQIVDGDSILHHRVNEVDRRLTRVETKCNIEHERGQ